jgi:hypothetical protein
MALVGDAKPRRQLRGSRGPHLAVPSVPIEFKDAACAFSPQIEKNKWFPKGEPQDYQVSAENTRDHLWVNYCSDCPILERCLDWALAYEQYGIWAGTTPHERYLARQQGNEEWIERARNRAAAGYKPLEGLSQGHRDLA